MRFANVRELKNKTSEILRLAERETVVITSNGKPRAIIKGVSESTFEDYVSAPADKSGPREMKIAESNRGASYPAINRSLPITESSRPVSPAKLKAVFWDNPDLANEKKFAAFLRRRRETKDAWALEWALTRFLEHGRAVDAMKYFGLDEIHGMLPKLRLSPYTRKKWTRILEVYEYA
jgi:prevent-host-death family protein